MRIDKLLVNFQTSRIVNNIQRIIMKSRKLNKSLSKTSKIKFKFLEPQQVFEYKIFQCPRINISHVVQFDVWNNINDEQIQRIQTTLDDSPQNLFKHISQIKQQQKILSETKPRIKRKNLFIPIDSNGIQKIKKKNVNKNVKWFR